MTQGFAKDKIKPTILVGFYNLSKARNISRDMLRISTKLQYGLRATIYLARCKGKICPLKEISQKERISFDYLEKIISKLEKAGLIKARKGAQGGYFLSQKPSKIKIGKIIRALEGEKGLVKCMADNYRCPMERKCLSKKFWKKIQSSINSVLNSLTLADLIK